jgi:hypothetical protein
MGPPLLIGAGLGAATSLAMGKNPFMGALLGGATGGAFGGAGGFGSGFTQGGGLLSSLGSTATGAGVQLGSTAANLADDVALNAVDDIAFNQAFSTALPTNVAGGVGGQGINISPYLNVADDGLGFAASGAPATGIQFPSTMFDKVNPLSLDPRRFAVDTPLTFGERLSDIGSSAFSYGKDNPMTVLGGANTLSNLSAQTEQNKQKELNDAVARGTQPIAKKDFDPSSVIAAAPSYGLSRDEVASGKVAQMASKVRLNDEDKRRIGQFYQSLIG